MNAPHKIAALLSATALLVGATPLGAEAAPKPLNFKSGSWIIADADTGEILAAKNPNGHFLPASTQKVLTAVALIPKLGPDHLIKPTQNSCDPEGTKVGIDTRLSYKSADLFRALLMTSANDAAMALTQPQGGMKPTLKLMNDEARRIGAKDTVAGSPNGLDVDLGLSLKTQHTTAHDLAVILREGLKNPQFVDYASEVNASFPAITPRGAIDKKTKKKAKTKRFTMPLYTHIRMLWEKSKYTYPGFIAGKNGYTEAAHQTFVGAAKRGDKTLIIALMKSDLLWEPAKALFDWGFANLGKVQPVGKLADPLPSPSPSTKGQDAAIAPPPGDDDPSGGNGGSTDLLLGGIGGAFVLAGVGVLVFRRRQTGAPDSA